MPNKQWDAFISHASEDKDNLVRPLAKLLASYGAKIWYDEFELRLGKSLSRSIDGGIANSRFGIVVLSEHFIKKEWTEYELKSLNALEIGQDGVILSLWHDVTREQVLRFSPFLADKYSISTSKLDLPALAIRLLEVIRPDVFERIASRTAWNELLKTSTPTLAKVEDIRKGPIRHEQLSDSMLVRIRFIRSALHDLIPQSLEHWVDDFKRDIFPSDEVLVWERIATITLEMTQAFNLQPNEKFKVFELALDASFRGWDSVLEEAQIPVEQIQELKKLVAPYK